MTCGETLVELLMEVLAVLPAAIVTDRPKIRVLQSDVKPQLGNNMNRAESWFPQPSTAPVTPTWRWEVTEGHANIDLYADLWRELAHRSACSPIGDAWWTRAHWRAFATRDQQPAVHVLFDSSRLVAVLPLIKQGRILRGWRTFTNGHTPYWMTAVDAAEATVAERILDHLLTSSDYVELDLLHEQGNLCTALIAAARAQGLPIVQKERGGDTFTELFGPWDAFRRTLSKNLETKTARHYRQLQSCGKVSFSMIDSNDQLAGVLEECFAVEARGWKGLQGTPIQSRPDTLQFYTELAHAAAALRAIGSIYITTQLTAHSL